MYMFMYIYSCVTNNTLIVYAVKKVVLFSQLLVKACNRMCAGTAGRIKAAWLHVVYVENETLAVFLKFYN